MLRRRAKRLEALLLAVVVIGGWGGLPAADVLLYHRHATAPQATGAQVADQNSPSPHGLRCVLGVACHGPRLVPAVSNLAAAEVTQDDHSTPRIPDRPRSRDRSGLPQERAPPISGR
jgi:hypothetical protein